MQRWQNHVAVVTGANNGIGEVVAKDLVKSGLWVVSIDRCQDRFDENRSKLPKSVQTRFYSKKCDISNEYEVKATFDWIEECLGGTDILVNCDGCLKVYNTSEEIDTKQMEEVFNANLKGLIYCTQAAFKSMKARNFAGHIINMNYLAGHSPIPRVDEPLSLNVHAASKFAATAINETISNELRNSGTKIKTTSVTPGAPGTGMMDTKNSENLLSPEDISQVILSVISTPPHVQIHEIGVKHVGEKF